MMLLSAPVCTAWSMISSSFFGCSVSSSVTWFSWICGVLFCWLSFCLRRVFSLRSSWSSSCGALFCCSSGWSFGCFWFLLCSTFSMMYLERLCSPASFSHWVFWRCVG